MALMRLLRDVTLAADLHEAEAALEVKKTRRDMVCGRDSYLLLDHTPYV
jgi:hypothetical protein